MDMMKKQIDNKRIFLEIHFCDVLKILWEFLKIVNITV